MPNPDRKAALHLYRMKVVDETGQPIKENDQEVFFEAEQRTNGVMGEKYFCVEKGCENHSNSRGWKRSDQLKQHARTFHNVAFQDLRGIECKRVKPLRCGCGLEYTKPQGARSHFERCQAEGGFRVGEDGSSIVSVRGELMFPKGSTGHFKPDQTAQEAAALSLPAQTSPNLPSVAGPSENRLLPREGAEQDVESSTSLFSCPVGGSLSELSVEPEKIAESLVYMLSNERLEMELNRRKLAAAAEPRERVLSVLNSGDRVYPARERSGEAGFKPAS